MSQIETGLRSVDIGRMRLVAQRLVGPPCPDATQAVAHLGCVQGQDLPGATTSIALRTADRSLAGVRDAFDSGQIVRSWTMRGTLHVVAAADLDWMLALTGPLMLRQSARRREEIGLSEDVLQRAAEIAEMAIGETGLSRAELLARWSEAGIDGDGGRGYHLVFALSARGLLCFGPMAGREQLVVSLPTWIRPAHSPSREEALAEWLRRYVLSHGPVPVPQFTWWTKLPARALREAIAQVRSEVLVADIDGVEHWLAPDLPDRYAAARRQTAGLLLLPGFDEMMLGYGDRSALLTREQEERVVPGRNGVFRGTVIHRGRVVGTWKRSTRRLDPVQVEPFAAVLPAPVSAALPRLTERLPR